jgi:hypothetical protein
MGILASRARCLCSAQPDFAGDCNNQLIRYRRRATFPAALGIALLSDRHAGMEALEHCRYGRPCPLWVIRDRRGGSHTPMHVRFAPKADKIAGTSAGLLCANRVLTRRSKHRFRSPLRRGGGQRRGDALLSFCGFRSGVPVAIGSFWKERTRARTFTFIAARDRHRSHRATRSETLSCHDRSAHAAQISRRV